MDIVCTMKHENLRSSHAERASQCVFFGVSSLVFAVSAALTIHWCAGMPMGEMPMSSGRTMSMIWMRMCGQTWIDAAVSFLAMWLAMMVAMMLPSLTPVLWRFYVGAVREPPFLCSKAQEGGSWVSHFFRSRTAPTKETASLSQALSAGLTTLIVGLGYFFVWTLLGMAVYPIGVALTTLEMRSPMLVNAIPIAASGIVLIAGALQFTTWKADRLDCCRAMPRCHLLPTNIVTAWRYGLRLGLHCSYCCAGLTAILLVIGIMDLRAMAVVTVAITVERLAPTAGAARVIGVVAVVTGVLMLARAAALT